MPNLTISKPFWKKVKDILLLDVGEFAQYLIADFCSKYLITDYGLTCIVDNDIDYVLDMIIEADGGVELVAERLLKDESSLSNLIDILEDQGKTIQPKIWIKNILNLFDTHDFDYHDICLLLRQNDEMSKIICQGVDNYRQRQNDPAYATEHIDRCTCSNWVTQEDIDYGYCPECGKYIRNLNEVWTEVENS